MNTQAVQCDSLDIDRYIATGVWSRCTGQALYASSTIASRLGHFCSGHCQRPIIHKHNPWLTVDEAKETLETYKHSPFFTVRPMYGLGKCCAAIDPKGSNSRCRNTASLIRDGTHVCLMHSRGGLMRYDDYEKLSEAAGLAYWRERRKSGRGKMEELKLVECE